MCTKFLEDRFNISLFTTETCGVEIRHTNFGVGDITAYQVEGPVLQHSAV